jgi:hypothetical protein
MATRAASSELDEGKLSYPILVTLENRFPPIPAAHHTCPAETPVKADDKWLPDIVFAACAPSPPPSQRISQTSIKYAITIN